jgi:nucleotide-binding universal stress UspA family protein
MQLPTTHQHTHLAAVVDLDDQTETSIASDPVIEQARRIVRRTRSALTLLCFQSPPSLLSNLQSLVAGTDLDKGELSTRHALFALARRIEKEEGVSVRCEAMQVPYDPVVLADWLRVTPADLLLLPKPDQQNVAVTALNGLSQLIRQTGTPVWFVEQGSRPQHGVVAAVSDGAEEASGEMRALDYEVVDAARGIGSLFSSQLHLVQAADEPSPILGTLASADLSVVGVTPARMGADAAGGRRERLADRERSLESFARATGVADEVGEIVIQEGDVPSVVSHSAETLQAGLIVMGASDKSRWETIMHGGTVEATLTRAPCDVLYVKNGDGEHVRPQALLSHSELEAHPQPSEVDLIVHPRRHFATPLVVLRDEQLSWQSKVLVLEAWEEELENEATQEKMPQQVYEETVDPGELNAVRQALSRLGARSAGLAA